MERILRARILDLEESLDSGYSPPTEPTPVLIGRVFDGGAMPAAVDRYFLVHPAEADGDPTEGGAGSVVPDTSSSVAVDVIGNRVPRVGDMLECFFIGGRWVAESRSRSCVVRICVQCSTDLASPAVVGAVVTIKDPDTGDEVDSGTTDALGCVSLDVGVAGDYKIKIASTGRPATNVVRTIACGDLLTFDLCGTPCELCTVSASSLTLTLSNTTTAPTVLSMTFSVFGGGTWTAFNGTQTFSLSCSDPTGWVLTCSYFDTTISGGVTCPLNLGGDCDGPDFTVLDLGGCVNITSSTGYTLPITITL